MKLEMSKIPELPHRIDKFEWEAGDRCTEIGEILFVNCLWGQRDKAEAISHYLEKIGYHRD